MHNLSLLYFEQGVSKMIHVTYTRHQECVNEKVSIGDICYKCEKCGRKFEKGVMVEQAKDEKPIDPFDFV